MKAVPRYRHPDGLGVFNVGVLANSSIGLAAKPYRQHVGIFKIHRGAVHRHASVDRGRQVSQEIWNIFAPLAVSLRVSFTKADIPLPAPHRSRQIGFRPQAEASH